LTRQQFCARNQIARNTFNRYILRYSVGADKRSTEQQLVAVEIVDSVARRAEVIVVLGGGRRVEVARDFDVRTLQQVVSALEAQ